MNKDGSLKNQLIRDLKEYRKVWLGLLTLIILTFLAGIGLLIFMAEQNDGQLPFFYVIH